MAQARRRMGAPAAVKAAGNDALTPGTGNGATSAPAPAANGTSQATAPKLDQEWLGVIQRTIQGEFKGFLPTMIQSLTPVMQQVVQDNQRASALSQMSDEQVGRLYREGKLAQGEQPPYQPPQSAPAQAGTDRETLVREGLKRRGFTDDEIAEISGSQGDSIFDAMERAYERKFKAAAQSGGEARQEAEAQRTRATEQSPTRVQGTAAGGPLYPETRAEFREVMAKSSPEEKDRIREGMWAGIDKARQTG